MSFVPTDSCLHSPLRQAESCTEKVTLGVYRHGAGTGVWQQRCKSPPDSRSHCHSTTAVVSCRQPPTSPRDTQHLIISSFADSPGADRGSRSLKPVGKPLTGLRTLLHRTAALRLVLFPTYLRHYEKQPRQQVQRAAVPRSPIKPKLRPPQTSLLPPWVAARPRSAPRPCHPDRTEALRESVPVC